MCCCVSNIRACGLFCPPSNELEDITNLEVDLTTNDLEITSLTPETIIQVSLEKQIAYKRLHMQEIARWVLTDYERIRENLSSKSKNNSDLSFSVSQLLNEINTPARYSYDTKLIEAVNAFKDIDGESRYPKTRLLDETILKSRSEGHNPLTIVEDASVDGQTSTGYELDEDNELYQLEETPTEENTANRNLVIIELDDTDCD